MGELNEEKLKQMLKDYLKTVQSRIDDVDKGITEIKCTLRTLQRQIKDAGEQQQRPGLLWLSSGGLAIIGIGIGMFRFATNTPDKIENGIVVVVGLFIFTVGLYYSRPSKSKDTSNRDS